MNEVVKIIAVVFAALLIITGLLTMFGAVDVWMIATGVLSLAVAVAILLWVRRSNHRADPA